MDDNAEMDPNEFANEAEMAEANDPSVGTGTPETAPREASFDDDDALDDSEDGTADGDDDDARDDPEDDATIADV